MTLERRPWPGLWGAVVLLLLALVAQLGVALGWLWLWPGPLELGLLAGLSNITALTLVAALGYWRSGQAPALALPPGVPAPFWGGLLLTAVGATVVLGELANLTTWFLPLSPEMARMFNGITEGSPWVSLFTLSVVAPVTEEPLFRGLFLRGFAERYGPTAGLLLSSALFALFHLNVWQALAAFVAGLYLGWVYLKTRSLWPSMAAHGLFNGLPVLLAVGGLSIPGYNTPSVPGEVTFQPWPWVLGGAVVLATGLWLSVRWAPLPTPRVSDTVAP